MAISYASFRAPHKYIPSGEKIACAVCKKGTRLNKPWCPEHINESPYVKWIQAQIDKQEDELREVRRSNSSIFIEDDSLVLREILSILSYRGAKTINGLSKEMNLDPDTVSQYINHLRSLDMVLVELNKRKSDKVVHLLDTSPLL
jgi:predicted HTH transcriptional regulator